MEKFFGCTLGVSLVVLLVFGGFTQWSPVLTPAAAQASSSKQAPDKPIELKFAHHIPPKAGVPTMLVAWGKRIEEGTNGRVKITFYPAQSLVKARDFYDACSSGICDFTFAGFALDTSRFRLSSVHDLPGLGWPNDKVYNRVAREVYEKFPEIQQETKEVKPIFISHNTPAYLHFTKKTVRTPAQLKGMKMIAGGSQVVVVKTLGAVPVSMATADKYLASLMAF